MLNCFKQFFSCKDYVCYIYCLIYQSNTPDKYQMEQNCCLIFSFCYICVQGKIVTFYFNVIFVLQLVAYMYFEQNFENNLESYFILTWQYVTKTIVQVLSVVNLLQARFTLKIAYLSLVNGGLDNYDQIYRYFKKYYML